MGSLFGGGSSAPSYIPAPAAVQAIQPDSVEASKAADTAIDKQKQLLASSSNTSNNIATTALGVPSPSETTKKTLLGQ